MTNWMVWWAMAGALVILEMFSGTFYLLMIAIGLAVGGGAALAGAGQAVQFVLAAVAGIAATYGLRQSRWGKVVRGRAERNPDINLDIGQRLTVETWNDDGRTARAAYRGAAWDLELEPGSHPVPGSFVIREVRGNRLIVANSESH
jgi:membrane protein implicated in regulation of membrane protease activity